jgi:D-amino peptidase
MRILIATDMEGTSGVVNWDQVTPGHFEYARFRKIYTAEVNAAIQGAFEAGATEVIVTDGHDEGYNILLEDLDSRTRLNAGLATAPLSMMQGIDERPDGAIFLGYHARAGSTLGVLDHTWNESILNVWLNETLVGEFGLNGALAGHFGVPVILVTGDQTACAQTADLFGDLERVVVKQATGRYSALCLPLEASQAAVRDGAERALTRLKSGDVPRPWAPEPPIRVTVQFRKSDQGDRAMRYPGSQRDGNRVAVTAADMPAAYIAFRSLAALGSPG